MGEIGAALGSLRELNFISLLLRLCLAVICGGLIGLEREFRRRPAGFRTYLLVCVGAAAAMLIGQYAAEMLAGPWGSAAQKTTDVTRIGAQVINGIGFLGAGTVLVTGRQQVRGLTTAAGLWSSACLGLAVGAGFFECVVFGFLFIFLSFRVLPRVEAALLMRARTMNLFVTFRENIEMAQLIAHLKSMGVHIYEIELGTDDDPAMAGKPGAVLALRLPRGSRHEQVITSVLELECIARIEEL